MQNKNYKNLLIIILFFLIILKIFIGKTYYTFYPGIPIYLNNIDEIKEVKKYIKSINANDIEFFYKTNESIVPVFLQEVQEESYINLKNKITNLLPIILFLKFLFNRARPAQIDNTIKPLNIDTAQTPSFPAGHTFQAYYLSKYLSKKYPNKKEIFENIAKECDLTRVKAGLHYPSDGEFSKKLVDLLF
jgi:hypothetical protein